MGFVHVFVLLFLFLFLATPQHASALKCASCIHLDFITSPPPGFPNIYRNSHCADFNHEVLSGNVLDCPKDMAYVCGTVQGVYTFSGPTVEKLSLNSTLRRCLPQPQGFDGSSETSICLDGDKATSDINLIGAVEDFGDMMQFDGQVCYCNSDNCNEAISVVRRGVVITATLVMGSLVAMVMVY